jgi:tetratricopeptide (TPR) repeat protein
MGKGTRTAIGYGVVAFLVGIGILAFFILQGRIAPVSPIIGGKTNQTLQDGINQYRKGEYEQASLFLNNVINASRDNGARSTASLYLGNISYRKGDTASAARYFEESIDHDEENLFAYYNAALVYARMGDLQKSQGYAREAVARSDEDSRSGLLLANIYFSTGRLHRAEQLYSKLTNQYGISRYNLAMTLLRDGRITEALGVLRDISSDQNQDALLRALSSFSVAQILSDEHTEASDLRSDAASSHMQQAFLMFSSHNSVLYNHALLLLHEGRYEETINLLRSNNIDVALKPLLAYALYKHGEYTEALPLWEELFDRKGGNGPTAQVLGDIHYHLENWDEAVSYYGEAVKTGEVVEAHAALAQAHMRSGDFEKALQVCRAYAIAAGEDPMPLLCLADLYFHTGPRKQAIAALEKAVRLIGDDEQGLETVASLYARHGMYNSSLRLYGHILTVNPERSDIHGKIAEIYMRMGHGNRAREELLLFLKQEENRDILYDAAILLAGIEGGASGMRRLQQLIQDFPDRYEAFYNIALLLFREGRYRESLEVVEGYLDGRWDIADRDASLMHTLSGVASARLGMEDRAALHFSTAVEFDGDNETAALNLKLIQEYPF